MLNNKIKKVSLKHNDIIKDIKKTNFNQFDIVTGSAFLDITPYGSRIFIDLIKIQK